MAAAGPRTRRAGLPPTLLLFAAAIFVALGVWQIERRAWKLGLLDAVAARAGAPPRDAPGPSSWRAFDPRDMAYAHVRVRGTLLSARETPVQAVTERGGGYWVMTPLRTRAGWTVLVNRGFVPPALRDPARRGAAPPSGPVTITGLLRPSEPGGGFLRSNDPAADRWYSRDVAAIARARGLGPVAPYFIDAAAGADAHAYPVGGLTVVTFPNNHLAYAITWFTLAAMSAGGAWALRPRRLRQAGRSIE